jgi:3-hydroxyisobutyrate dehydrogenase-like beta-hydroxyacid dehydrogenase
VPAERQTCARGVRGRRHSQEHPERQVVVDLGTSSVSQTRDFAGQLQAKGAAWADAPIARTRQAAQDGTLSVMVGATPALYANRALIRCFATDVTHCGEVGAGR